MSDRLPLLVEDVQHCPLMVFHAVGGGECCDGFSSNTMSGTCSMRLAHENVAL